MFSFGLSASNSLRGLLTRRASQIANALSSVIFPMDLRPASKSAIRPCVMPTLLPSCSWVYPRFCLNSLRLMAHLTLVQWAQLYNFKRPV
nr:MAG TPA: hypothetical protein [Caudoviricetes sp.]